MTRLRTHNKRARRRLEDDGFRTIRFGGQTLTVGPLWKRVRGCYGSSLPVDMWVYESHHLKGAETRYFWGPEGMKEAGQADAEEMGEAATVEWAEGVLEAVQRGEVHQYSMAVTTAEWILKQKDKT